jgi:hypothetical protein
MKRPVSEVIAMLQALDPDAVIDVNSAWSDGKTVRQYKGQEKYYAKYGGRTSPARGFRKMTSILIPEVGLE